MKRLLIGIALAMPVCAMAQVKPVAPVELPQLSTVEAAQMQEFDVKIMAVLTKYQKKMAPEMQRIQDKRKAYIEKLNAAHPGYAWHDPNGPGTPSGFLPIIPAPASPPAAPTAPAKALDTRPKQP